MCFGEYKGFCISFCIVGGVIVMLIESVQRSSRVIRPNNSSSSSLMKARIQCADWLMSSRVRMWVSVRSSRNFPLRYALT